MLASASGSSDGGSLPASVSGGVLASFGGGVVSLCGVAWVSGALEVLEALGGVWGGVSNASPMLAVFPAHAANVTVRAIVRMRVMVVLQ